MTLGFYLPAALESPIPAKDVSPQRPPSPTYPSTQTLTPTQRSSRRLAETRDDQCWYAEMQA